MTWTPAILFIGSIWVSLEWEKSLIMKGEAPDLRFKGSLGCLLLLVTSFPCPAGLGWLLLFQSKLKRHWFWNLKIPSIRHSTLVSSSKIQKNEQFLGWHMLLWQSSVSFVTVLVCEETKVSVGSTDHVFFFNVIQLYFFYFFILIVG